MRILAWISRTIMNAQLIWHSPLGLMRFRGITAILATLLIVLVAYQLA